MTPQGDNIVDLLPRGALLKNPFTIVNTEPMSGQAYGAGVTGYVPDVDAAGVNTGYTIDGIGRDGITIIIELTHEDYHPDMGVLANCLALREHIEWISEQYYDNEYPYDLATDTGNGGTTVMFWIERSPLINPYNNDQANPVDGRASNPGETGYEAVWQGDAVVDFIITGVGQTADSIIVELTSDTATYRY
jgi:hypothetical protein